MVEVRLGSAAPERSLRLFDYQQDDPYIGGFRVGISAEGLDAEFSIVTGQGDGLDEFVADLAADFRGWEGERLWRSLEDTLALAATWRSGGHVRLGWTARRYGRGWCGGPLWSVGVEFILEAGEQLAGLAADLEDFFRSGVPGGDGSA
ncbi:DUF6228 family protein [Actinomadura logoneensis]|nr:DUF6228 family protein [Actinomadura logoneensis]